MKLRLYRRYELRDWLLYPAATMSRMFEIWRSSSSKGRMVMIDEFTYKVIVIKVYKVVDEETPSE